MVFCDFTKFLEQLFLQNTSRGQKLLIFFGKKAPWY